MFSTESLAALVKVQGYAHFAVVDQPSVIDDFIYKRPVVAIASRFPITAVQAVAANQALAQSIGLTSDFSFSRNILRATIDVPHLGLSDCYVVHFKSKRSMLELDNQKPPLSPEKTIIESLKAQVAGGWGSTLQRGSEAALLMIEMINRREQTQQPMVLMGDFNNSLADGVLSHLLTNTLSFVSTFDRDAFLAKYCLQDAWDLFQAVQNNEAKGASNDAEVIASAQELINGEQNTTLVLSPKKLTPKKLRAPTHYYGATGSVLDYILLSCEFDASYHDSLYQVSHYHTYDQHLINPIFERDRQSTDHAVISITLMLRT